MLENPFNSLSDEAVHQALLTLAREEREAGVDIILHLVVVKARKLYAAWGHDSLFSYCTERLGFSRSAAYRRKTVVDRVDEFPELLKRLGDGRLQLCAAAAIAPHLTHESADELLEAAAYLSHREVEAYLVKRRQPVKTTPPEAPTPLKLVNDEVDCVASAPFLQSQSETVNVQAPIPTPAPGLTTGSPMPRTIVRPLTANTSRLNVTFSEPTLAKLKRLKELMAGKTDDEIFSRALDGLLERLAPERREARREKRRAKATAGSGQKASKAHKATRSRRGALADRDRALVDHDGQCAFVGPDGHRCTARAFIEVDHVLPWSIGGASNRQNYQPLCKTHNLLKGAAHPGKARFAKAGSTPRATAS